MSMLRTVMVTPHYMKQILKKVITSLIKAGADLEARDDKNRTPLYLACVDANKYEVKILLEAGANPNPPNLKPLLLLTSKPDIVKMLLDVGLDPNIRDPHDNGRTPLHKAITCKEYHSIKYLLNAGANPKMHNNTGFKPIDIMPDIMDYKNYGE